MNLNDYKPGAIVVYITHHEDKSLEGVYRYMGPAFNSPIPGHDYEFTFINPKIPQYLGLQWYLNKEGTWIDEGRNLSEITEIFTEETNPEYFL